MDPQQNVPAGSEVRVVSASVIAQLQAQGLQVRWIHQTKITIYDHHCDHINVFDFGMISMSA